MEIYLVRHGQTKWNHEKRMQGSKNSDLTEQGIEEAKRLGRALEDIEFDRIYSSPLGRTLETMEHIRGDREIPLFIIDELQEMDFGHLEGRVMEEAMEEHGDLIDSLWNDPENYENESGENYYQLYDRVKLAYEKILEERLDRVIVVSHGVIISVLMTLIEGGEIADTWDKKVVKNTSLTILEVDEDGRTQVKLYNNTDHLED